MDVAGAQALQRRILQRQHLHWREAAAVREGRQEAADPDAEHLVKCSESVRVYEPHQGRRFLKELVGGRWETVSSADAPLQ